MLERADHLKEAAKEIQASIDEDKIREIVSLVPEDWLTDDSVSLSATEMRSGYVDFLLSKLNKIDLLVKEAEDAR